MSPTLALICPVVFSLASAAAILRPDLRHGARGRKAAAARPRAMRGRGVLVVAQVALAVILLTVSSLALRSMRAMYSQPTGMEIERLLVFGLEFNDALYPDDRAGAAPRWTPPAMQLRRRARASRSMAMVSALPILGDSAPLATHHRRRVADATAEAQPTAVMTGAQRRTLDRALGLRMLAGRVVDRRRARRRR